MVRTDEVKSSRLVSFRRTIQFEGEGDRVIVMDAQNDERTINELKAEIERMKLRMGIMERENIRLRNLLENPSWLYLTKKLVGKVCCNCCCFWFCRIRRTRDERYPNDTLLADHRRLNREEEEEVIEVEEVTEVEDNNIENDESTLNIPPIVPIVHHGPRIEEEETDEEERYDAFARLARISGGQVQTRMIPTIPTQSNQTSPGTFVIGLDGEEDNSNSANNSIPPQLLQRQQTNERSSEEVESGETEIDEEEVEEEG